MFDFSTYSNHIACITPAGESLTYARLEELSCSLAEVLQSDSLTFILCKNTPAALVGYVAALQKHSVGLLLNAEMDVALLRNLIEVYQPQQIWLPTAKMQEWVSLGYREILSYAEYVLLRCDIMAQALPQELAILLTTSGSTGSPKLVRLSHENLLSNAISIQQYLQISDSERPITSLPMYYSYGLSVINSHLISGATLLLTENSYVEQSFWEFARLQSATSFAGVPYTYEILKKLKVIKSDLPCLKTFTQAGGKLSEPLIKYFTENLFAQGKRFFVMYGQTEATARMSYMPLDRALQKIGSVGIAIPNGRFYVENDGKIIEEPNQVGELVYQGKNVSLGYATSKEHLYCGDDNHGTLHTGDLAYLDADGFVYIVGRTKRFIKLFGNRISLDYLENLIQAQFGIAVACVGTDEKMIVYTTDSESRNDLLKYLVATTHLQHSAFDIRYIKHIPHSETGKILYNSLSNT